MEGGIAAQILIVGQQHQNNDVASNLGEATALKKSFHGIKRQKCTYGKKRNKNSQRQRDYDEAMANNTASEDEAPAPGIELESEEFPKQGRQTRPRWDDNWRATRGVMSRDTMLAAAKKRGADEKKTGAQKLALEKKQNGKTICS